ncbi:MAG: trimeric intracellular cation channel family protein [Pseudomonadales bacterium]|jgi:uncharacterized membrane protein YeiH
MNLGIIPWLDLAGVFVFAVSGALVAARKNMDVFGFTVIALITAVGGGTIRDLLVGLPVFWIQEPVYVSISFSAAILTFLFVRMIHRGERLILWFDAVGLAVFCVLGAAKCFETTGSALISIMMGVITAVLGGMMRDVVCNEVPLIFHGEIYATAAFLGATVYVLCQLLSLPQEIALWAGISCAFALRAAAMLWGWSLPKSKGLG